MEWWQILLIVLGSLLLLFILSIIFYKPFFKRFWDVFLSGLAIIVFLPLFLLLTIAGAISMKGNPFFIQKRPGKISKKTGEEKIIQLLKFRSMTNERDADNAIATINQKEIDGRKVRVSVAEERKSRQN